MSGGVVKDDAQGMAMAVAQLANTVAQGDAVVAARSLVWSLINRKRHGITLRKRHDSGAGLHAGALFCQHELSALEVFAWL